MVLRSKCILAPCEETDGTRISIMSRHTLNDGKTPDKRLLAPGVFDEHRPEFAAPPKLVGAHYKRGLVFDGPDGYGEQYVEHMIKTQKENIIALIKDAVDTNITVMCIEDTPEKCHRRLFVEYCQDVAQELWLALQIQIR